MVSIPPSGAPNPEQSMKSPALPKSWLMLIASALILVACGDDDPATSTAPDPDTGADVGNGDARTDTPTADIAPDLEPDAVEDADTAPCPDEDQDGVCDDDDLCPGADDGNDADGDGVPDGCDVCDGDDAEDTDGDGVPDDCDVCADGDDAEDSDGDGTPEACDLCPDADDDADADADGVPDGCDACPDADDSEDADGDSVPDACDVCDGFDDAEDADEDGVPNGCDVCTGNDIADEDGDWTPDACDVCPGFDDKADADGDEVPDGCDVCDGGDDRRDGDADGVPDDCDNCVEEENPEQLDSDGTWTASATTIEYALRESPENELTMEDDEVQSIELGFEWRYFGLSVDEVFVSSNGFISVTETDDDGCCSGEELPGAPGVIAGFWDDLNPEDGGRIAYGTTGEEGAREFVVAFEEVSHCCGDTPTVSFQIVLRESGGAEVHCASCGPEGGFIDEATQGVESWRDGASATIEGRNAAAWEAIEDGAEFTWSVDGGDGVGDVCDACPLDSPDDSDEDLVCDFDDVCDGFDDEQDADEDGVPDGCDICEDGDDTVDTDGDGTPDDCDACPDDFFDDSDGDGICDSSDICDGGDDAVDADGDGVADFCDACEGFDDGDDWDADGTPDACDTSCPPDDVDAESGECLSDCDTDTDGDAVVDCYDLEDGDVVITEFLADPTAVGDSDGEWFELHNPGSSDIYLDGAIVSDRDGDEFVIDHLEIPAGGNAVLTRNGVFEENGGVASDHDYDGFTLANEEDEIIVNAATGAELDRVEYDALWPIAAGASTALGDVSADNNSPENWCLSDAPFGDGDSGTPGAENDPCTSGDGFLYASDGAGGASGNLYRIDVETWEVETVGPIGAPVNGLAFAPDGTLYGVTSPGQGFLQRTLVTIDIETGAATTIAGLTVDGGLSHIVGVPDIAFHDGVLYAWTQYGDNLATIDTETGELTLIDVEIDSGQTGFTIGPDGTFYLAPEALDGNLYTIDPETGATSLLVAFRDALGQPKGMTWIGDTLYVTDTGGFFDPVRPAVLGTVNLETGSFVAVPGGPVLTSDIGAITFNR